MRLVIRTLLLVLAGALVLQLFFVGRIALGAAVNPQSTTVQRSQAWQLLRRGELRWHQQWLELGRISPHLQRAVLASEDDAFVSHTGVDWKAIRRAWQRNREGSRTLRGGSTVTQQLAKNLLLSGERSWLRKAQELVLAWELELLLGKHRILELYLNTAEWGSGVFGAEAAARHYFGKSATGLTRWEAARLAVMLPDPRGFELQPSSSYLERRTRSIMARMHRTQLP